VAACVSGGLDSSSVACEGERLRREGRGLADDGALPHTPATPLTLLRAAFPGLDCDERPYSDAVAAHLGLPIETCYPADEPDIARLEQAYPDLYFHPVLTMLDPLLGDLRRRGIRVVLTGAGGDMLMETTGLEGAHYLRQGRLGAAVHAVALPVAPLAPSAWRRLAGQGLRAFAPRAAARFARARRPARARWPWLSREAANLVDGRLGDEEAEIHGLHPDPLTAGLCHTVSDGLSMACNDRIGALHTVEHRHPFYDVRVFELLLALPLQERFTRQQSKGVLRRALGPALPERVSRRRDKADFGGYVRRVFLEAQRSSLQRLFHRSLLAEQGLVDEAALHALLEAPPEAQRALGLVDLTAMELWLRYAGQPILEHHLPAPPEDQHEVA
jgi:asparagine synthase (glutamine-hydrolysing)